MRRRRTAKRDRSTWPAALLAAAFLLAMLGIVAAAQGSDARTAEPGGGRPDAAAAQADVDPRDHDLPGWYTAAQADRGREAYAGHCAECHSPDLRARATYISLFAYPALTGAYFWDRWSGQTVHALLLVTEQSMPLHAPGTLDGDTYAEIIAHVLRVNGFPSGDRELPAAMHDVERLVAMPIEPDFARPVARAQRVGARQEAPEEEVDPQQDMGEPDDDEESAEGEEPLADGVPDRRDGWFTQMQVDRARDAYFVHCSRCHGAVMQGGGVAPALAGANFQERWDGESLADLFWVVSDLMPLDDQGALDPWTSADLVAYILSQNDYPSGTHQLPPGEELLEGYVMGEEPE